MKSVCGCKWACGLWRNVQVAAPGADWRRQGDARLRRGSRTATSALAAAASSSCAPCSGASLGCSSVGATSAAVAPAAVPPAAKPAQASSVSSVLDRRDRWRSVCCRTPQPHSQLPGIVSHSSPAMSWPKQIRKACMKDGFASMVRFDTLVTW